MIIKKISMLICVFTLQATIIVSAAEAANSKNRSWYLGAGLGLTQLNPETNDTGYDVADSSDSGFKLFGGYDFTNQFTVEGFLTDLGSASITSDFPTLPDGSIDYSTFGVSALWYFVRNGDNKGKNLRKGLQVYAHGGLSSLSNSASVDFNQNNSVQIQYGAGVEYGFNNGIAVRAGLDLYDKDASMVFVGVMKRFGVKPKIKKVIKPTPKPEPTPKPVVVPVVVPVVTPVVLPVIKAVPMQKVVIPVTVVTYDIDTDKDGVYDRLDECADSSSAFRVDEKGCSIIELEFGGVNFELQSFELTQTSKDLLNDVVVTINASPELEKIEVSAHTDDKGPEKYNLKLSKQRAKEVRSYLIKKGVREDRLVSKGYGESQPIADNKTEEGRAKNRRVELTVIKDDAVEIGAPPKITDSKKSP
ncbi:Outer membrane protein A precursor [hydrothermal vent metagenome]|uniref:Outer membrane protein A n=1 Tax=hydrothermal vent metagenome TaxID=652676 RepID=A0A3B0WCJ5_9ZZZZ